MTAKTRTYPSSRAGVQSVTIYDTQTNKTQNVVGVGVVQSTAPPSSSLVAPLLSNGQTFYSPTLANQLQFLDPPRLSSTTNIFDHTLTPAIYSLGPPLLTNTNTFFSPTFTSQNVDIAAPLLTNTSTIYGPTMQPGVVNLSPPVLDENDLLPAPEIIPDQDVAPPLHTNVQGFFSQDFVSGGVVVAPSLLDNVSALYAPTIAPNAYPLLPPLLSNVSTIFNPTTHPQPVQMLPPLLSEVDALPSPSLTSVGGLQPPLLSSTVSLLLPTVTSRISIAAPLLTDVDTLPAPSASGGGNVFPPLLTDPDALIPPTIQRVKGQGNGGGGSDATLAANLKYASTLTMAESGLITGLQTQIGQAKTGAHTRMIVYADASGVPGAKLAESVVKTGVTLGTNSYTLITPLAVLAGTTLWIALHTDTTIKNVLQPQVGGARYNTDTFSDGASDPFGPPSVDNNRSPLFVVFLEAANATITAPLLANGAAPLAPVVTAGPRTLLPPVAGESFLYAPELHSGYALDVPLLLADGALLPPTLNRGLTDLSAPLVLSGGQLHAPTILPPSGFISPPLVEPGEQLPSPALGVSLVVIEPPLVDSSAAPLVPDIHSIVDVQPPFVVDADSLPGPSFTVTVVSLEVPLLLNHEQLLFDPAMHREPGFLLPPLLDNDASPVPPSFLARRRTHGIHIKGSASQPSLRGRAVNEVDIDGDASGAIVEMEGNDA